MYSPKLVDAWNDQAGAIKSWYICGIPSVLEVVVTESGSDTFNVPAYTEIKLVMSGPIQRPLWKFIFSDFCLEDLLILKSQGKILSYDIEARNIVSDLIDWVMEVDDEYKYYCPNALADVCYLVNKYGIENVLLALDCMYAKSNREFISLARKSIHQSFPVGLRAAMTLAVIPEVVSQLYIT
jgi:hypothetical protein